VTGGPSGILPHHARKARAGPAPRLPLIGYAGTARAQTALDGGRFADPWLSGVHIGELSAAAADAVRAGGGTVLDSSHVIFPNGAVTLVLILAESHLAIHTWPEEDLIAVDLFSCGSIAAERVAGELIAALQLADARVQRMERGTVRA